MKNFVFLTTAVLSVLSFQAFAALPDLEANSLIKCEEASTVNGAVSTLNGILASSFWKTRSDLGNFYKIENYVSSQPTITKLDNGTVSVCVTLTRKK